MTVMKNAWASLLASKELFRPDDHVVYKDQKFNHGGEAGGKWYSRTTDDTCTAAEMGLAIYDRRATFYPMLSVTEKQDIGSTFLIKPRDTVLWQTPAGFPHRATFRLGRWEARSAPDGTPTRLSLAQVVDLLSRRALLIRDGKVYWPWAEAVCKASKPTTPEQPQRRDPELAEAVSKILLSSHEKLSKATKAELESLVMHPYKHDTVARLRLHAPGGPADRIGIYNESTQKWWVGYAHRTDSPVTWRGAEVEVLEIIRDGEGA